MKNKEQQIEERLDRKTALRVLQDLSKRMSPTLDLFGEASLFISRPNFEVVRKKYLDELHEDSVVLSRGEYEEYKKVADGKAIMVENITDVNKLVQFPIEYNNLKFESMDDYSNYIQDEARKETAEKILTIIGNMLDECDDRFKLKDYQWHKDLCKQFGVEIKERENER